MKIIALADIHGGLDYLSGAGEELRGADLIVIAGDITNFGGAVQIQHIISEISRYTTIKFVFVDEDLRDVRVAGLFKAGDVSGFLTSLRANFDISYEHVDGDTVQLSAL